MLASPFLESICDGAFISPQRMAERLNLPMNGLAKLAKVSRNTLSANPDSAKVQQRLGEVAKVIARATELAEDERQAIIWFKYQVILGFGKTAEQLVEAGHADLVLEDLERIEAGVYS